MILSFFKFSKKDIFRGSVAKSLFFLSFPLAAANFFQVAYHLVDTFWLGRVGTEALAAIAYALPVTFLVIPLGGGIANAGSILIAQYKGAGSQKGIDYTASQTLIFLVLLSFFVSLVGFFGSVPLLRLLGAEAEVLSLAQSYLQTFFVGTILIYGFVMIRNFFRGVGNTLGAMWIALFSVFLNLFLDPFLIFGWGIFPEFGVGGAALATVIARGLAASLGIFFLFGGKMGIHLSRPNFRLDFLYLKRLAKLGFPVSAEAATRSLGIAAILPIIAPFGAATLAAYGIGSRLLTLFFMIARGMSQGVTIMVGQNLGAGQFSRARTAAKESSFFAFFFFSALGLILFWQAEFFAGIFTGQIQVQIIAAQFLRVVSFSLGFLAVNRILAGAFRGGGATLAAMMVTISAIFILLVPSAVIFSKFFGQLGIWLAFSLAYFVGGLLAVFWFVFGKWQKKLVEEKTEEGII